jgi:uncharacterized protein with GYD domain
MPTYLCLYTFTDQGVRNIEGTIKRADAFRALADSKGCKVKELFWTLGPYDMVTICDVPDDMTATALGLALGKAGNVRTLTMRAFSHSEMDGILAKLA